MGFSLRNFLEESVAQVNPFDKGQTAKTVKNDRQAVVAQTKKVEDGFRTPQWQQIQQKANQRNIERRNAGQITPEEYTRQQSVILGNGTPLQQGQHTFKSQPLIRGAVRDIFDSNSEVDKIKRQQQGLPTLYRDQQIAQGNTRPYENIGAQFLGNTARALNTTAAAVGSIPLQARIYAAEATKNNTALENALRDSQNYTETITDPGNGLLNTGTLWNGVEDFNKASLKENLKRSAINTVGVASEVAPFKINPAKGAKFTTRLLANAGVDAAAGTGESVARQYANTGRVDLKTLAGDVAANTLLGSAQVGGSKLISKVNTPEVRQKATNIARGETAETLQLRDTAIKLQQLYDKTTSTTTRRTIAQQLSDVNAQIRSIKEGGYVGKESPQGKTDTPKTVKIWTKSRFNPDSKGTYAEYPVIRREDNITLYQGSKPGEQRQYWTPNKKYAEQFGEVKEKTGSFYKVDNGNRMTDVYVEVPNQSTSAQVGKTEAIKQAQQIAKKTEALKKQGKITPNDEGYWTTPVKGQPKDPIPNVKDVNGVQVKEGDVIEVEGLLGGKARRTVQWQEPQIANATGELQPGQWLGNGPLDNGLPFKIVKENTTPPQVGKTEIPDKYIKEYADMLKSMDDGATGGQLMPNGEGGYIRTSEHSKIYSDFYKANKRKPSNKDWLEIAKQEAAKDKDFMEYVASESIKNPAKKSQGTVPYSDSTTNFSKKQLSIEDPEAGIERMKNMPLDRSDEGTFAMPKEIKVQERGGEKNITVKRQAPTLDEIDPEKLKDISSVASQFKDIYRNTDRVFGEQSKIVREKILNPLDDAKGKYVDFQEKAAQDLKKNIVDGLGIKKGSKESALVQQYGEGKVTFQELTSELGSDGANRIAQADKFFRSRYDRLLDLVNESRMQVYNGNKDKIIPKRKDYYRHFQEMQEGIGGLLNIFDNPASIAPELAGVSDFTKPKSKWLSLAQRRTGDKTTYDAVGGYINYLQAASYATNIDPQIARIRNFRDELVGKMGDDGKINNYLEFLNDYTNDLSGKTNAWDRSVQKLTGRKAFNTVNWINRRAKSNAILGNFSSSIAQFFNIPNGIADAGVVNASKGAKEFFKAVSGGKTAIDQSTFIKERFNNALDTFDVGLLDKTKNASAKLVQIGDEIGTKWIWHAEYQKALSEGLNGKAAVRFADNRTRATVAGRGIGEVPLLQKSKMFQVVAPFQLEVANQWHVWQDWKGMGKKQFVKGAVVYSVAAALMNNVAEKVRGNDVVFDPIDALTDAWKELFEQDDLSTDDKNESGDNIKKAIGRLGGEILGNVPGGAYAAQALVPNEFERKAYFGSEDPSRFGTSPLALTNTFSAAKGVLEKPTDLYSYLKAATGVGTPFGGKQLERTIKAGADLNRGYVTDKDGNPKFNTPEDVPSQLQSLLFGSNSVSGAQDYYDQKLKPLTDKQTAEALQGNREQKRSNIDAILKKRADDRATKKEKATFSTTSTKGSGEISDSVLGDNIKRLSDGKFAIEIDGEVRTFDKLDKAQDAEFVDSFKKGKEKVATRGNKVYIKDSSNESGYRTQSKADYEYDRSTATLAIEMDLAKEAGDIKSWSISANRKADAIVTKLEQLDPETDFKEIASLEKQLLDLNQQIGKYGEYGGFKKPKKGKTGDYKLLGFGNTVNPISVTKSLRQLLNDAIVSV